MARYWRSADTEYMSRSEHITKWHPEFGTGGRYDETRKVARLGTKQTCYIKHAVRACVSHITSYTKLTWAEHGKKRKRYKGTNAALVTGERQVPYHTTTAMWPCKDRAMQWATTRRRRAPREMQLSDKPLPAPHRQVSKGGTNIGIILARHMLDYCVDLTNTNN